MTKPIIEIENLGKSYRIGANREKYLSLRDELAKKTRGAFRRVFARHHHVSRTEEFRALNNVSLSIQEGEAVGIIGSNGAGKSTLLKILSLITPPTTGKITMRGRVASLLEVGTGFHPDFTGRENIFLNGAILGMRRDEIRRKFDEIVAFADVEKFIDTPVKHYSSGMYVRLAFAVAAHLEPEILLVDEVLAVGDAAFQKKCLGKMGNVVQQGRTILFVSHNIRAITELCQKAVWIEKGRIREQGESRRVVVSYMNSGLSEQLDGTISADMHINATGDVYFRRITVLDKTNAPATKILFGQPLRILMEIEVCRPVENMRLIVAIEKLDGTLVSVLHHTDDPAQRPMDVQPGHYSVLMETQFPLMPGGYTLHLGAKPAPGYWGLGMSWDWVQRPINFYIEEFSADGHGVLPTGCVVRPLAQWRIAPKG